MKTLEDIKICVVGLGYVGLPLACLFSPRYPTIGFDIDSHRVESLMEGNDSTLEIDSERLQVSIRCHGLRCTDKVEDIGDSNVYIITVPTPVDANNHPDLQPLLSASRTVGSCLRSGDVVVYESTVYPGVTEEVCVPALVQASKLVYNEDFFVGYSPERVNPGDKLHSVETICKVVSGSTPEAAAFIDSLYLSVLKGGTHKAPSIRVAEAAKIIENSQRDVNIAFMNELAKIFNAMGIDTGDVIAAAATKWNFIPMKPGLVGGHCISVDPYYLIERAQVYGVLPRVMYNARRLNDGMGDYVANRLIKLMNLKGLCVKDSRILILGFAFKENCPDIRNSKVVDIFHTLREYTSNITVCDPWVDVDQVRSCCGIEVVHSIPEGVTYDAALLAVPHRQFASIGIRRFVPLPGVVYDVKGFLPREDVDERL